MSKKKGVLFFVFIILLLSCNTTEPPPPEKTITLTLEDAASIEAWIKLTTTNLQLPATITLKQNNQIQSTINLVKADTLLYIDSLLPSQQYTFQAATQQSSQAEVKSNVLSVATLDTTSQNFTWQSWTFGEHSSSRLNDVAIIDENNIWAVGEVYLNDSLGQTDPEFFNLVKWDGNNWNIQRIKFTNSQGQTFLAPIKSVFAFNENDVWLGMDQMIHWNGNEFIEVEISPSVFNSWINKIWGTSSEDLYIVGNNGNIAHYSGPTGGWQKIESGTDVDIQDIWGVENNFSGEPLILCAASYVSQPGEKKILRITNVTQVDTIFWGTGRRVHSLWFNGGNKLFASGGGVFIRNYNDHWVEQTEIPLYFTERVRGRDKNDVFAVGHFGLISHYNGSGWKTFPDAAAALVYTSLDYKNNLMVTVGYTQNQAVIQFMIKN